MPSHSPSSALVQMYHDGSGAPWSFPQWIAITGVTHGIFPSDPRNLPKGWTSKNVEDVQSYFSQYNSIHGENEKIAFASSRTNAASLPGRAHWKTWIVKLWARCHINDLIIESLTERGMHPMQLLLAEDKLEPWPPGPDFIPLAIDTVALRIFGPEALNGAGMVQFSIRHTLHAIIQRTWSHIHKQTTRNRDKFERLSADMEASFEALDREKPSRQAIRKLIRDVARWKTMAQLFGTTDILQRSDEIGSELEALMSLLGAKVKTSGNQTTISKGTAKLLQSLASEENVQDLIALYRDYFADDDTVQEYHSLSTDDIGFSFADPSSMGDPGVEIERQLDLNTMKANLGLVDGLPLLFNRYRLRSGLSCWSQHYASVLNSDHAEADPEVECARLHDHQIMGIHASMRLIFSKEPSTCTGVLIADDVGLGKTFQALSIISLIASASFAQLHDHAQAPIIAARRYLGQTTSIPNLSHLIIVPGTLMAQWETEAKTVFRFGSVDILLYKGGKARSQFWSPDGVYSKSRHSPCHIIIIASSSAVQSDFNDVFLYSKAGRSSGVPWAAPLPRPGVTQSDMSKTIFGRRYLTVVRDEAQDCRNLGAKHASMLAVMDLAHARLILTATPLQTCTKDIAAMGRLVGVPHFLSEAAFSEEKNDEAGIRRAKREALDDIAGLDSDESVRRLQVSIAHRMQGQFGGRVIRRTVKSVNSMGGALVDLPPCVPIVLVIDLTSREMNTIRKLSQKVADSVSGNNGVRKLGTKAFYMEYRMAVGFVLCNGEIPKFESLEEWEPVKSTKMDVCCRICKHLLSSDQAPMVYAEDGGIIFPPIPEDMPVVQTRRILIYQEFTSLSILLQAILNLYGIASAAINGDTSFEDRAKAVNRFTKGDGPRVLITSAVGGVGLNLSCADTVIFLDQPWSAQDVRQIRGRVHRQPQQSVVHSIHLLASETADILLAEMAEGKKDMLEAFLSKDSELRPLLTGMSFDSYDDDTASQQSRCSTPTKPRGRKRKKASSEQIVETGNPGTPAEVSDSVTQHSGHVTCNTVPAKGCDSPPPTRLRVTALMTSPDAALNGEGGDATDKATPGFPTSPSTLAAASTTSTPCKGIERAPSVPTLSASNSEVSDNAPELDDPVTGLVQDEADVANICEQSSLFEITLTQGRVLDEMPPEDWEERPSNEVGCSSISDEPGSAEVQREVESGPTTYDTCNVDPPMPPITTQSALKEIRERGQRRTGGLVISAASTSSHVQCKENDRKEPFVQMLNRPLVPIHRQATSFVPQLSPPPAARKTHTNPHKRRR